VSEKPILLLLPGLDGSGMLFDPLLNLLPSEINVKIAPIPAKRLVGYTELAKAILTDLPEQQYVILAESFSGRTAYELCRLAPEKIAYVVFVASFINKPSRLLGFALLLPLNFILKSKIGLHVIGGLLFGIKGTKTLLSTLYQALIALPTYCLNNRLAILNQLRQPSIKVDVPCVIVTAKHDLLLNRQAQKSIEKVFTHHAEQLLDGPHFLIQTHPEHVVNILQTLYAGLADIRKPPSRKKLDVTGFL
jgi:pimeloyl-ACP methyl ester carboxylesterase